MKCCLMFKGRYLINNMTFSIESVPYCEDLPTPSVPTTQLLEYEHSMSELRRIAYGIIAPLLIVLGVVGNMLNLIVLARPFFNSCTRIYLRAVAIADINILLFEIPMVIRLNNKQNSTAFAAFYYAYVEIPTITVFVTFNVYIVTCLTIDRYISVCAPTYFNHFHTPKKAKIAIAIALCVSVLLASPLVLLKTTCHDEKTKQWSFKDNLEITDTIYWCSYIIISEILIRMGPAVIVAVLNILIVRQFKIITKKRSQCLNTDIKAYVHRTKKYQEEKRLIILLQAIVVVFCTTMIPSSCLSMLYSVHPGEDYEFEVFRATANLLEMANFGLNFCAYFLCSAEFRKGLLHIFTLTRTETLSSNNHKHIATITL